MRVLVTGAAGFIGGAVARALASREDVREVVLLDRVATADAGPKTRPLAADVSAVGTAAAGVSPDLVVHCAGITTASCEADPEAGFAVNVAGTRALLAWCRTLRRPPRLVLASTVAVFGGGEPVVDEASPVAPRSTYGTTKAMAELLVRDADRRGEIEGVTLRLPVTMVRPGRTGRAGAGYLSDLLRHAAAGRSFTAPLAADRMVPVASLRAAGDAVLRVGLLPSPPPLVHVRAVAATGAAALEALAAAGIDAAQTVRFQPDPTVERLMEGWPERLASLHDPAEPETLAGIVEAFLAGRD